jgi:hypothetical protein
MIAAADANKIVPIATMVFFMTTSRAIKNVTPLSCLRYALAFATGPTRRASSAANAGTLREDRVQLTSSDRDSRCAKAWFFFGDQTRRLQHDNMPRVAAGQKKAGCANRPVHAPILERRYLAAVQAPHFVLYGQKKRGRE